MTYGGVDSWREKEACSRQIMSSLINEPHDYLYTHTVYMYVDVHLL